MASETELLAIKVALRDAQKAVREAHRVASAIDEIGDEAAQTDRKADRAARSISRLGAASTTTRVNLGPFSTSMRGAALVMGGVVLAAEKLTPAVLSAGEAVAVLAGGGAAAGGVGFLALKQASAVATLGISDLTDALGGNQKAMQSLSPEAFELFRTLTDAREQLKDTAGAAILPGLTRGGTAAMRNFRVINGLVRQTGRELGRLGEEGGNMLGSPEWGRDMKTLGAANVRIIGDLGDAGMHLADAARHILVEAAPLTEWLSENAEKGAEIAEAWAAGARAGGELRRFFAESKTDMRLFGESLDHVVDGFGNLFGLQDVSGTRFLAGLEHATDRFEAWTNSPAVRHDFGAAIRTEVADGVAAAAGAAAEMLPLAAGRAAMVFWQSFWSASPEAKLLLGLVAGKKAFTAMRGTTPFTPMFVKEVAPGSSPTGWLKGLSKGGAGATALRVAAGGASVALPAGLLAALVYGNNKNLPSGPGVGASRHSREAAGRPAPGNVGAFERVADPGEVGAARANPLLVPGAFEPIIPITLKVGDEKISRITVRAQAKKNARRR